MKNHNEKLRDVARGVLPSEARKSARDDLRNIKQKNRRAINRQLARIDTIDTYFEDPRVEDLEFYPDAEIGYVVRDRRGADKLSVMRWAEQRTKQEGITDPHERYEYAKRALPTNLAGRHALTHIRTIDGFCDGTGQSFRGCDLHSGQTFSVRKSQPKERSFEWLVDHFTDLITKAGQHQALNSQIKRLHTKGHVKNVPGTFHMDRATGRYTYQTEKVTCGGCDRPRVLAGSHDVAAWVADVFFPYRREYVIHSWWRQGFSSVHTEKTPYHVEWRTAAQKFI
jgi:hypothetical protein